MGLRFNPSATTQTQAGVDNITKMAMVEWQKKAEEERQLEQGKRQLALLAKMGLIDGMPSENATPVVPATTAMPQSSGIGGLTPQAPGAAMSMLNGGVGDAEGTPLPDAKPTEQAPMALAPAAKKAKPFLVVPNTKGGYSLQKNPDYKTTQSSAISTFDVGSIKPPKNEAERMAAIESLPPEIADNVKAAGEYRLDANKIYGLRNNSGDRAKFDALVNRLYPGWNMQKYPQRQAYMNDLAKGNGNKQVLALNTLAKHMQTWDSTMDSLKNGNIKPQNAIINFAKDISGDPTITDFKFAKEIVNSELERLLTGVGVTQQGMERVNKMLSANAGYDQMKSASKLLKSIVRGRIEPLRTQYKNMMGEEEDGQILFPESKQVFEGQDSAEEAVTGKTKSGLTYTMSR